MKHFTSDQKYFANNRFLLMQGAVRFPVQNRSSIPIAVHLNSQASWGRPMVAWVKQYWTTNLKFRGTHDGNWELLLSFIFPGLLLFSYIYHEQVLVHPPVHMGTSNILCAVLFAPKQKVLTHELLCQFWHNWKRKLCLVLTGTRLLIFLFILT
jgi:hypothetical protein